jgi:hypothetical protein
VCERLNAVHPFDVNVIIAVIVVIVAALLLYCGKFLSLYIGCHLQQRPFIAVQIGLVFCFHVKLFE